ncbi:uncharacterized protein ACOB8E_014147 [Sarcophilus harrisii]
MSGTPLGVAPADGRGNARRGRAGSTCGLGRRRPTCARMGSPGRGHGAAVTWVPAASGRRRRRRRRSSPAPEPGRRLGRRRGLARGARRTPSRPGRRRRGPRPPCPSAGPGSPPPPHGPGRLGLPGGQPAAGASPKTTPGSAHPPRRPPLPAPRATAERSAGRPRPREESEREHGLRHPGRSVKATTTGAVLLLPTCRGGHWACANADHIRMCIVGEIMGTGQLLFTSVEPKEFRSSSKNPPIKSCHSRS